MSELINDDDEGGYGWIVVFGSFLVHFLVLGLVYSFGVFYSEYLQYFNGNASDIAWIGSIGVGMMAGMSALSGNYADCYGNSRMIFIGGLVMTCGLLLASISNSVWQLYLTQGAICGIGYSFSFVAGVSVVGQWFKRRRGLAVGIAVSGSGLGQFVLAPITQLLISEFGWRQTLRILALIVFVGMSLCSKLIRRKLPKVITHSSVINNLHYFRQRNFSVLYLSMFLSTLGYMMPFTYIVKYSIIHDISVAKSVLLLSFIGVASALGRVGLGLVADKFDKIITFRMCMLIGGISTICWMWCTVYYALIIYAIVFGFFAGGLISLMPVVCAHLFGTMDLGNIMGLLYTASAVGNLLGAPLAGVLYDVTGSYTIPIVVAGACMVVGTVTSMFLAETVLSTSLKPGIEESNAIALVDIQSRGID